MMAAQELELWLGGRLVAHTVTQPRSGAVRIVHTDEVSGAHADGTVLLSCSLPTPGPSTPGDARAFLEGLLPEGRALEAAAAEVRGVRLVDGSPDRPTDVVALLAEYGRECAGAIVAVPTGAGEPGSGRYEPVDGPRMAEIIRDLPRRPLGADPSRDIRMSLAGAQPKFLLARLDGAWFEPVGGAASTHLLKPTADWAFSAHNEALVVGLARAAGLTECPAWVEDVDGVAVFVTARYDREVAGPTVTRCHQEDLCQALGIRPKDKYHVGRPSETARRLRRFADDPGALSREMFRQVAFRTLVGDEDGHGKNYAVLLDGGSVRLAPIYDTLCTLVYPDLTGRMASKVGRFDKLARVDRAALVEEGTAMGLPARAADAVLDELASACDTGLARLPGSLVDGWPSDAVVGTIRQRVERLAGGAPLGGPLGVLSPKRRRASAWRTMSEPRRR